MTRRDLQHTRYEADDNDAAAGYPDVWPPRSHTSSVRWSNTTAPATTTRGGYNLHTGTPPKYRRASLYQPQANQSNKGRAKTTEDLPRRWKPHWLLVIGLLMIVMIVGYVAITSLFSWVISVENHWKYGSPPVYQIDAVVGHHDNAAHPSHFIALNLNGQVEVIEFPGGDVSHARIYTNMSIVGSDPGSTPVTISFKDLNGDGKPDMIVTVGNGHIIFLNENGQFIKQS